MGGYLENQLALEGTGSLSGAMATWEGVYIPTNHLLHNLDSRDQGDVSTGPEMHPLIGKGGGGVDMQMHEILGMQF